MKKYKEPFKLGFIGGSIDSAIGYTHYIASQMDHLFILTAGCFSRNKDINERTALTWGVEEDHLYLDWEVLLEKEVNTIDAIVILTPTPSHYKIIMKALDLGYAIISEKALTSNYNEALEISKKIKEKNAFFAMTHNYTAYPMIRELQHMIKENKLGKIININIEMPQESFIKVDKNGNKAIPQEWRLKEDNIAGISLDLASHLQHMVYFLTQENPIKIVADQSSFGWFPEVIDDITYLAKYKSKMKTQMWYGKSSIGHRNGLRVRVYGTKGSAQWFQMEPEELLFNTIDGNRSIIDRASNNVCISNQLRYNRFKSGHPAGFIEAFANLYFDISQKLAEYKINKNYKLNWSYTAEQATKGLEIFEAINKSVKEEKWIEING